MNTKDFPKTQMKFLSKFQPLINSLLLPIQKSQHNKHQSLLESFDSQDQSLGDEPFLG